jgi:hypothetical protein
MKFNCIYNKYNYVPNKPVYTVQKYNAATKDHWPFVYDVINKVILDVDLDTKEKYLKWVSAWKKVHAMLVADIKALKKSRKTAENGYVPELKIAADAISKMYKFRRIYKLASGVLRQKHIDKTNSR